MSFKRRVLSVLSKPDLLALSRDLELGVVARMSMDELRDVLASSKRARLECIVTAQMGRDTLKAICDECGLDPTGKEKQLLVDRILAGARGRDNDDSIGPPSSTDKSPAEGSENNVAKKTNGKKQASLAVPEVEIQTSWLSFPQLDGGPGGSPRRTPTAPPPMQPGTEGAPAVDLNMTLPVQPRKPRLVWQGMNRKEVALPVPTQVVEIVRPGRALVRGQELALETRQVTARDVTTVPPNRLIWTNDNVVALQTLIDERDPTTRDYRYRGKVDLVYIDPPFMVNNDFRADNAIDIELDDDAGVQAKKEPSLVEILAYKDTWRQGLDSFLTMLRRRLELLKQLLAPTASIYVHLDWHAVHYVKVMMDEIFGYDNFINEVVWKRSDAKGDSTQGSQHYPRVHDSILIYAAASEHYWSAGFAPLDSGYVQDFYKYTEPGGRRWKMENMLGPGGAAKGNPVYEVMGVTRAWRYSRERMASLISAGLVIQTKPGTVPMQKRYLDDSKGVQVGTWWDDISMVRGWSGEKSGYPTQKPIPLLERVISTACPPGGLVLDCFIGSGTTAEAAERLGRRWIGIDNSKFGIHLARKRLIQLHGQARPSVQAHYTYDECGTCKNIERKEKPQKSPGPFQVQPFTVENMGVYQRAEQWQDFQTKRSLYRDEMVKVFGGEPVTHSPLLHGRKGNTWVHVGPLDGPISVGQVWNIAREAQGTGTKAVTILSADFDTLSGGEKDDIKAKTGVTCTVRVIPASALDECRRRLDIMRSHSLEPIETMAIPAFYAPLSIMLQAKSTGRTVQLRLDRCEVDIESFVASQRPMLKLVSEAMAPATRKKAQAELDKWDARQKELNKWLAKATTWQKFVDYWAIDWDYGSRVSPDGKPIFETDWQSFRVRRGKAEAELTFTAEFKYEQPGQYRVAARVTDVFGNDGIATTTVEVR